jgi:CBS domain-containing protein
MVPVTKPLFSLTAADLMSGALVVVPEEMSLKGAAHLLAQASVTGAPVINAAGRCIGVLSATDFVHYLDRGRHGPAACATSPAFCASWQIVEPERLPEDSVCNHMTRDPVMVTATATIGELARKMVDVHIHRVIVVDRAGKPIGIVSSTDVLAAVARADLARTTTAPAKARETVSC